MVAPTQAINNKRHYSQRLRLIVVGVMHRAMIVKADGRGIARISAVLTSTMEATNG